jgi:16S rRNA (guanine1207-N2)-methyltransferase
MLEDIYYKKTINFNAWKHSFQFKTSQELFSSHDIDIGTRQLLRTIMEAGYTGLNKILDLGCGYGPLGLTLKALFPDSQIHLVDKDALALEYSRQNAELNKLNGREIYASLGYDDLKSRDFNLIVSNIPGKAGEPVIAYLLREAAQFLSPGGIVAVVVVEALELVVSKILSETPGVEVILKRDWADHTVFHYLFSGPLVVSELPSSAVERGIYKRHALNFHFGRLDYPMDTAFGLPDFDSLGNENEMLFNTLKNIPRKAYPSAVVFNPGQGHAAVMLWKLFQPDRFLLVDRDLLALKVSHHNLALNNCPSDRIQLSHQLGIVLPSRDKIDLAVVALREDEGAQANFQALSQLDPALSQQAVILVTSGSTAITRLVDNLKQNKLYLLQSRDRWRGQSLLTLTRR